jgi:hypothetical protein
MAAPPVHEFQKNTVERVRASITRFKAKEYIDIRVYYEAGDGEWHPTRKGLCLGLDLIDELEIAVKKLKRALSEASREVPDRDGH